MLLQKAARRPLLMILKGGKHVAAFKADISQRLHKYLTASTPALGETRSHEELGNNGDHEKKEHDEQTLAMLKDTKYGRQACLSTPLTMILPFAESCF